MKDGNVSVHNYLSHCGWAQVVNYSESRTLEEIIENSTKLITLIDLCGHQKYIKTTIFGLTGYSPDFAMLVVSAVTGVGMYLLTCVYCTFLCVCCVLRLWCCTFCV